MNILKGIDKIYRKCQRYPFLHCGAEMMPPPAEQG